MPAIPYSPDAPEPADSGQRPSFCTDLHTGHMAIIVVKLIAC